MRIWTVRLFETVADFDILRCGNGVSNILPCPALSPSGASQDAHLLHFPPRLNPPLPLSPQARILELVDRDICSFAMTELLSPQLPRAWRSYFEITFVFGMTSCDAPDGLRAGQGRMLDTVSAP